MKMATRQINRVLNPRNRSTSLDVERENFEKNQVSHIFISSKSCNLRKEEKPSTDYFKITRRSYLSAAMPAIFYVL